LSTAGLTVTELRRSTGGTLLADCASGPIPIRSYRKQIATLSLYDHNKKHTFGISLKHLAHIDLHILRGATVCLTHRNKPLLTLEFMK
jgi:hypothetical protein